ncbi:hypothetical protein BJX99DRAFT_221868 [Aspergillus californicus]
MPGKSGFPSWDNSTAKPFDPTDCPEGATLLEKYSHIPRGDIADHVTSVARRGWDIAGYPCFRRFLFLDMDVARSPHYTRILERVKRGALFIDLGCGLGQDVRRLAFDGVPSENLYGLDLHSELVELGYELFRDRETLKATFLAQDFFEDTPLFRKIDKTLGVINSGYFMHLWDWEGQVKLGLRMVKMLASGQEEGGLIVGVHFGLKRTKTVKTEDGREMFVHNSNSLLKMWGEIEGLAGRKLRVEVAVEEDERCRIYNPDTVRLRWSVLAE